MKERKSHDALLTVVRWSPLLVASLLLATPACEDGIGLKGDDDTAGDADTDADTDADADADGDSDGDSDTGTDTWDDDWDDDGLDNDWESENGLDPNDPDSDDDGVSDLVEVTAGTDPLDPESNPAAEGNFFFLVPYEEPPQPLMQTLVFATDINKADVFILVDTTGSMGDEIDNLQADLSSVIIPGVADLIPDVWFGVGHYDDYPVFPHGMALTGDVIFRLIQRMTDSETLAQQAVNSLPLHGGGDGPEGAVPALYAVATGEGLSTYLDPQTACAAGEIGYPCFRGGAVPIVLLITDAAFHNGPGYTYPYNASVQGPPPLYADAVQALWDIHARVIAIPSTLGDVDPMDHCTQIASDTGAIDADNNPLVFQINGDGTGLSTSVVDAVETLVHNVPLPLHAIARDDLADTVDATDFIDRIEPNTTGGFVDPQDGVTVCVGGLEVSDTDQDTVPDTFPAVLPGTPVCFDIYARSNTTVPGESVPMVYKAYVDVMGDSVTVLDTREVFFLVPPSEAYIPPE